MLRVSSCPLHSQSSVHSHAQQAHLSMVHTLSSSVIYHHPSSLPLLENISSFLNFLSAPTWKHITPLSHTHTHLCTLNFLCSAVGRDKLGVWKLAPNSGYSLQDQTLAQSISSAAPEKTPLWLLILVCPILLSVSTANGILRFKNDSVAMDHYACHISDSDTNYSLTFQSNHFVYFSPHPKSKLLQEAV